MEALATKYRPQTFESMVGQEAVITILKKQLETETFKNTYLFCGPSGDGKTTIARIFANVLNRGFGSPIEIDGASNNGVDNVRAIIEESKLRAIDSEYKVIIIDECHMLTIQAWNAFLKCIEEPSPYTIFIFCTTDPQKIPATILNRVQRFNLTRIPTDLIKQRLLYIATSEGCTDIEAACDYIAKLCCGGLRDGIAMLEKCIGLSKNLNIKNVIYSLGNFSYETFLKLTNGLVDRDERTVIAIIEDCHNSGSDLKLFISQYLDFILDLNKYCLFKDMGVTKIPGYLKDTGNNLCVDYAVGFEGSLAYFNKLSEYLLNLKNELKNDTMPKTTVEIALLGICRGK